jgi:DNA polymerase-3 subunit epsilon
MGLNLTKSLVYFDIEATGLSISKDRIIEIAFLKIHPDQSEERKTWRVNPQIPIPDHTYQIHGISDDDVKDSPLFKDVAKEIVSFIGNADLAGFNVLKFDLPMLVEELLRVDEDLDLSKRKVVDVQRIYHKMEQRNLRAAYKFYCDKNLDNAHSADADTQATHEVLEAQVEKYEELKNDMNFLTNFIGDPANKFVDLAGRLVYNDQGEEVFNFGKHKGKSVVETLKKDPAYYSWMMNGDFPQYTKKKLTEIRLRMKQEQ